MLGQLVNDLKDATSSTETIEFTIPEDTVRLVIGAKGRTVRPCIGEFVDTMRIFAQIQRIKAVSGVSSIDFEHAEEGVSKCRISGQPESISRAEEMVKAISAGERVDFTKKVEEQGASETPVESTNLVHSKGIVVMRRSGD